MIRSTVAAAMPPKMTLVRDAQEDLQQLTRLIHSRTACCKKVRTLNGFDVWGHGIFCHGSFLPKPLENREIMWISEDAVNKTG